MEKWGNLSSILLIGIKRVDREKSFPQKKVIAEWAE